MDDLTPELDDWDDIISRASGGNEDKRSVSKIKANRKLVQSIVKLRLSVFSSQKNISSRLDKLNENINKSNESSAELSKSLNRLTFWGVIVAAVGVLTAVIKLLFDYQVIII